LKYPQSPLVPRAEQYLRNVQEVLADGEFRIARFYYVKTNYRAAAARLVELSGRYPLYSQSDLALSMLGNIYMRAKQASKNEDDKNHWGDLAGQCYSQIVKDYPLSKLAPEAKAKLVSMGMAVPKPDPNAVARMQKQQLFEKEHHPNMVLKVPMGMIKTSPDISTAAQIGQPNLEPPDDSVSATEVLNQGAAGPAFSISARNITSGSESTSTDTESVESSSGSDTTTPGAEIIAAPTTAAPASATPTTDSAVPAATTSPAAPDASAAVSSNVPSSAPAAATTDQPSQQAAATQASQAAGAPANANSPSSSQSANSKSDPKTESTSKKKKGLHKLIP